MNIYVVSDIHGFYNELHRDLKKAKFNENNDKLIVLGDMFDRGRESKEVYEYLKRLTDEDKAIVLHGNHEDFIIDFLEGKDCSFNYEHNGFNETIDSFLEQTQSFFMFCMYCEKDSNLAVEMYGDRVKPLLGDVFSVPIEVRFDIFQDYAREYINNNYPDLLGWLKNLPYYYETDNYIFTHASIDGMCDDWHKPIYSKYSDWTPWQWLTWDDGTFYEQEIINTDKTVVVGHFYTDYIRDRYNLEKGNKSNDILYANKKIFLDSCVVVTKRLNVLKINDSIGGK